MTFPLGKPILAMLVIAVLCGMGVMLRPSPARKDLVVWVFDEQHAQTYRPLIAQYQKHTGRSVDLQLVSNRALNVRLSSIFSSGLRGGQVPDLVELEIGNIAKFFRAPADDIGFLPLNAYMDRRLGGKPDSALRGQLLASRLAPWTRDGLVFGIPHDVHPVTLTYRQDLFHEAGIDDLEAAVTWEEFRRKCVAAQRAWRAAGYADRRALELPRYSPDYLIAMLLQRGINLVDGSGKIWLDDPRVAQTTAFYAGLVAGPERIAAASSSAPGAVARDLGEGTLAAIFTPDWRLGTLELPRYAPELAGRLRMMALPVFEPGRDVPTSTWGGTMMGIPRVAAHPDDAWDLLSFLYFSPEGLAARRAATHIIPPMPSAWADATYQRPDAFFGGQKIDELYVRLGAQIPSRDMSPGVLLAQGELAVVLYWTVNRLESAGSAGLEEACGQWLRDASRDLKRRMEQGRLEQ